MATQEPLFNPGPRTHEPGRWFHFGHGEFDAEYDRPMHVGTEKAAMDRAGDLPSRGPGQVHVGRIRANMDNTPETRMSDRDANMSRPDDVSLKPEMGGLYYENDAEDRGSTSAVLARATDFDHIGSVPHAPRWEREGVWNRSGEGPWMRTVRTFESREKGYKSEILSREEFRDADYPQPELPLDPEPRRTSPFDAL